MTSMERAIEAFDRDPWVRVTHEIFAFLPFDHLPFGDALWELLCDVQHWRMRVHVARSFGVSGS